MTILARYENPPPMSIRLWFYGELCTGWFGQGVAPFVDERRAYFRETPGPHSAIAAIRRPEKIGEVSGNLFRARRRSFGLTRKFKTDARSRTRLGLLFQAEITLLS